MEKSKKFKLKVFEALLYWLATIDVCRDTPCQRTISYHDAIVSIISSEFGDYLWHVTTLSGWIVSRFGPKKYSVLDHAWKKYFGSIHWTNIFCSLSMKRKYMPSCIHEKKMSALFYPWKENSCPLYMCNELGVCQGSISHKQWTDTIRWRYNMI